MAACLNRGRVVGLAPALLHSKDCRQSVAVVLRVQIVAASRHSDDDDGGGGYGDLMCSELLRRESYPEEMSESAVGLVKCPSGLADRRFYYAYAVEHFAEL